ncbi:MAG: hypothetical protein OQJ89_03920 [Kangiellaceae bacterium]|nr:hypothetical protein [Kangiellaceae bacterium]MCW8997556.1 hypothetical protein [Kangiellaceae bacterium]MCW9016087.1 hypothetical protein [Kangiellaceae bacterium]
MFPNRITRILLAFFMGVAFISLSTKALANVEGDWEGILKAAGQKIPVVLHLNNNDGKWSGTMDSPAQGGFGLPMTSVKVKNNKLIFELSSMSIHYEGVYNQQSDEIVGTFIQGAPFKLSFNRATQKEISNNLDRILGTWEGDLQFRGQSIPFVIHVEKKDGKFKVSHDSPAQGGFGIIVDSASLNEDEFSFGISALGSTYKGTLSDDTNSLEGTFSQSGITLPLNMVKKN